ncbi:MAG: hypothetical protein NTV33_06890 [Coprothermobacterota bacterium]|nr:hypothetical protein [Coprothermobacterota bacterium]
MEHKDQMPEVVRLTIPFGRDRLDASLPKWNLARVLAPPISEHPALLGEGDPLRLPLDHPIDSKTLEEWVRGKRSMVNTPATTPVPGQANKPFRSCCSVAGKPIQISASLSWWASATIDR